MAVTAVEEMTVTVAVAITVMGAMVAMTVVAETRTKSTI
jgi:hypothetical protein